MADGVGIIASMSSILSIVVAGRLRLAISATSGILTGCGWAGLDSGNLGFSYLKGKWKDKKTKSKKINQLKIFKKKKKRGFIQYHVRRELTSK